MSSATLLDRFGGVSAVSHLVFGFYDKVTKSPRLAPYFASADMSTVIKHQTQFLSSLMGGPASFTDEQIRAFHAHLGIDEPAFVEMLQILQATLRAALLDDNTVAEIVAAFGSRRSVIIGAQPPLQ
jgi:hemoglobin